MACTWGASVPGIPARSQDNSNELRAMLCSACKALEEFGFDFSLNPMLDAWWYSHREEDLTIREQAARVALRRQEALRIAKSKSVDELTSDDRTLLREFGYF